MDSDHKDKSFVVKPEPTLESEDLIGIPIKIEERDGEISIACPGSTSSVRIKTENSSDDEKSEDFEMDDIMLNCEQMKGEILEMDNVDNEQENCLTKCSLKGPNHTTPRFENSKYRSFYVKLGMMVEDEDKPTCYLCEFCGFYARFSNKFYRHYSKHFDNSRLHVVECPHCDIKLRRNYLLKEHIKNKHSGDFKRYLCDKCDFTTRYKNSFKNHQITHSVFKHEKAYYKCDLCNYETKQKFRFDIHKKRHIDASLLDMFKCNLCPYESKTKSGVTLHMTRHKKITETKSYDCELCAYKSKYPHLLRGHIKTNHKKFPKSLVRNCDECDFETNNKYSLETHVKREHKKPRPPKIYKCDKCPFTTKIKSKLNNVHSFIHQDITERKLFECHNCGIKYVTKTALRKHIILKHIIGTIEVE